MSSQSTEKIKVFARIRPSKEQHVQKVVHIVENNSLNISLNGESKHFKFDGLFGENSNQDEVFEGVASRIVHGTLQGYNGTIFAYGQTGSGKTHTMIGPSNNFDDESGIIPRGLHLLFEQLDKKREEMPGTFSAKITVSFVEIYNENIYDLFLISEDKLKIGQDQEGNAMVKGATEIFVKDLNDAMEEVRRGWNNRTVGETAMNRSSSRSHALLLIKIRTEEVHGGNTTDHISTARSAFLNLVDLAGSERASKVEAERFKETTNINKSLLTLKIVIRELSEQKKKGFIAFRNSVLTHILKDSLGGNARTAVMINIHPDKMYYSETVSTLNFSAEVRRIENKVVVNEDLKGESVNAYKAEIRRLQEEIENMKITNDAELAATNRNLQAWIAAANKFERQLAVARRNAVNVAIVARKDGQGAALAESIWDKSMAEIAESARKLDISDCNWMKLRELTTELDNCEFEKEELKVQLEQERKAKMELQEKLNRQSNSFRPVLDEEGEEDQPITMQQESFEEKELKLKLEVNTQKQIIDEKIQECARLQTLLEVNEKKLSESEEKLSSALAASDEKVKELTADIEKAKKTIGEENEKFNHLEKRANELEGELMELNGQVVLLQSDMDLMKSTHKDEMEALETNIKNNLLDEEKKSDDQFDNISFGDLSNHDEAILDDDNLSVVEDENENSSINESIDEKSDDITNSEDQSSNESTDEGTKKSLRRTIRRPNYEDSMEDSDEDGDVVEKTELKTVKKRGENSSRSNKKNKTSRRRSSQSISAITKATVAKRSETDMECVECEFRTKSVSSFTTHLRNHHSTTPTLAGLILRCECGNESTSYMHSLKCAISNFTVIRKKNGPIRRLEDLPTPQVKCVLCTKYPKTVFGYVSHLRKDHKKKATLISNEIFLRCKCNEEFRSESLRFREHNKKCDGRDYSVHKLKKALHSSQKR